MSLRNSYIGPLLLRHEYDGYMSLGFCEHLLNDINESIIRAEEMAVQYEYTRVDNVK
jgi:hypothetical protein